MVDFKVNIGDKVKFYFDEYDSTIGNILYIPQEIGDWWIIQTDKEKNNLIEYIQNFNRMVLFPKGD